MEGSRLPPPSLSPQLMGPLVGQATLQSVVKAFHLVDAMLCFAYNLALLL